MTETEVIRLLGVAFDTAREFDEDEDEPQEAWRAVWLAYQELVGSGER